MEVHIFQLGSIYFWNIRTRGSKYFEIYGPGGTKKGGPNLSWQILLLRHLGPKLAVGKMQILSRHQAVLFTSKQNCVRFETMTPINLQLDKAAAVEASRLKEQQERNRQILYRIIVMFWPRLVILWEVIVKVVTHNRGLFLEITSFVTVWFCHKALSK